MEKSFTSILQKFLKNFLKLQLKDKNKILALFSHFIYFISCLLSVFGTQFYHHIFLSICYNVLTHLQRSGTGYLLVILHHASVLLGLVQHCLSADSQCSATRNEPKEFCWNYRGWWSASIWESYISGENFMLCRCTSTYILLFNNKEQHVATFRKNLFPLVITLACITLFIK